MMSFALLCKYLSIDPIIVVDSNRNIPDENINCLSNSPNSRFLYVKELKFMTNKKPMYICKNVFNTSKYCGANPPIPNNTIIYST